MSLFVHRNAGGRCPCGAANAACGPPSDVVPVGQDIEEVAAVSGPLKKYRVKRNGFETVMKLSDEDAKKLGAGPYDVVGASTIEPVTLADDSGSKDDDGAAAGPDGAAAAMADTGGDVSPGMADGIPGPEPVQSPQDPGDGQAQGDAQAPADDGPKVQEAPAKAAAKPARKRAASSPNKARTGAANKADGGS
ncbi:hypothetical protein [Streptomyces hirsutus]|uniref:hypothetical protein n=1 Tax=Streptomyces hirsutus TaxID=35620 RepID=UPI003668EF10